MDPITLAVVFLFAGAAILLGESDDEGLFSNRALGGGGHHRRESHSDDKPVHRTRSIEKKPKTEPEPTFSERMKAAKEAKKNGRKISSANNRDDSGNHLPSKPTGTRASGDEPALNADGSPESK